jgi:hypothetical protein
VPAVPHQPLALGRTILDRGILPRVTGISRIHGISPFDRGEI